MKKGTMEFDLKVNRRIDMTTTEKKEQTRAILKEMEELRKEHPDIKIHIEMVR